MDHGFFIAMSYAAAAVAIALELAALAIGRRRVRRAIEEERELEAQD